MEHTASHVDAEPPLCASGPADRVPFYLNALERDEAHKAGVEGQIKELLAASPWAAQMQALQALRGVGPIVAATVLAEVGDFSRFAHPRQLVAYFGLAPGEHSSGSTVRPRGITKAGSSIARSVLCEAAWNYRTTPKVGRWMKKHRPPVPQDIIALAWKAQLRLHKTYRRLSARGKRSVLSPPPSPANFSASSGRSASGCRSAPELRTHQRSASARTSGAVEGILEFVLDKRQSLCPWPERGSPPTHRHHGVSNPRIGV